MSDSQRRLILGNGEKYVESVEKARGFGATELPRPYDEARILVKQQISASLKQLEEFPEHKCLKNEMVLCLRIHPELIAKSYDPQGIFGCIPEFENIGSRNYRVDIRKVAQTNKIKKKLEKGIEEITGRLVFVRSNDLGFKRLLNMLDEPEKSLKEGFRKEISYIERFDLLTREEQLPAFTKEWKEGRVEIVLHPSRYSEEEQTNFLKTLFYKENLNWGNPQIAFYDRGPMFISCYLTNDAIKSIAGINLLRTAHPMIFGGFEDLRNTPIFPAPPYSKSTTRSTIKVGVFDGGVDVHNPLLAGHVEHDESLSIKTPESPEGVAHGTAVAGALLYGALNDYDLINPIPSPKVFVVSFRAVPTSNPIDIDMYESIDVIETAVPSRKDIKIFNVSFGPRGPINEDTISRFTYALDLLAVTHKVTFCVAVGNDGAAGEGMDRIQSPADLVNGFGVGAYTEKNNRIIHAPYSCRGPGRECAKLKPDLVAFGGCKQKPIHLLAINHGQIALSAGTSFSSPIVASLLSQATENMERGSALLARALLIHRAEHPDNEPDHTLGHGVVSTDIDGILRCGEKEVTVVFQGDIAAKKMVKLPIMLPAGLIVDGKISVRWTVAALPQVEPNHPSDYTAMCLEDTFYPNNLIFNFTPSQKDLLLKPRKLHTLDDASEIQELITAGWKQSLLPVSASGNDYRSEGERRANYKWEPIVRRSVSKKAISLNSPSLILHAIPRHNTGGRLEYAAIVTITAPKFNGDLYNSVLRQFNALQPVRLRTEAELRIEI